MYICRRVCGGAEDYKQSQKAYPVFWYIKYAGAWKRRRHNNGRAFCKHAHFIILETNKFC